MLSRIFSPGKNSQSQREAQSPSSTPRFMMSPSKPTESTMGGISRNTNKGSGRHVTFASPFKGPPARPFFGRQETGRNCADDSASLQQQSGGCDSLVAVVFQVMLSKKAYRGDLSHLRAIVLGSPPELGGWAERRALELTLTDGMAANADYYTFSETVFVIPSSISSPPKASHNPQSSLSASPKPLPAPPVGGAAKSHVLDYRVVVKSVEEDKEAVVWSSGPARPLYLQNPQPQKQAAPVCQVTQWIEEDQAELQSLRHSKETLTKSSSGLRNIIQEQKDRLAKMDEEMESLKKKLKEERENSMKAGAQPLLAEVDELKKALSSAQMELKVEKEERRREKEEEEEERKRDDTHRELKEQIRRMEGELEYETKRAANLASCIDRYRDREEKDLAEMKKSREAIEEQTTLLKEKSARCVELERRLQAMETKVEDAESIIEAEKERKAAIESGNVEDFKGSIEDLQKELTDMKDALDSATRELDTTKQSNEEYAKKISDLQAELETVNAERELFASRAESAEERLSLTMNGLQTANETVASLKTEHESLRNYHNTLVATVSEEIERIALPELQQRITVHSFRLEDELTQASYKYKRECEWRRKLYNEVQELKGNIRVLCRVRPALQVGSGALDTSFAISFPEPHSESNVALTLHLGNTTNAAGVVTGTKKKAYEFDRVFQPEASQAEVFDEVKPLVLSILDGYNACIFAYGQTGSGKTYTMEGVEGDRGVNYRAIDSLFHTMMERGDEYTYDLSVSLCEVYCETIRDLLGSGKESSNLQIGLDSEGSTVVQNLKQIPTHSMEETMDIMAKGYQNRASGSTKANERSSRSHCVLTIYIKGVSGITGSRMNAKLHLIDLAGSERLNRTGASGDRMKEAQHINKSLSALGDVISALLSNSERDAGDGEKEKGSRGRKAHIPYRNSKLTHMLQDALGGDAKTLMFCNVSPIATDAAETASSLNFAQRARSVTMGPLAGKVAAKKEAAAAVAEIQREREAKEREVKELRAAVNAAEEELERWQTEAKKETEALASTLRDKEAVWVAEKEALSEQIEALQRKEQETRQGLEEKARRQSQTVRKETADELANLQKQLQEAISGRDNLASKVSVLTEELEKLKKERKEASAALSLPSVSAPMQPIKEDEALLSDKLNKEEVATEDSGFRPLEEAVKDPLFQKVRSLPLSASTSSGNKATGRASLYSSSSSGNFVVSRPSSATSSSVDGRRFSHMPRSTIERAASARTVAEKERATPNASSASAPAARPSSATAAVKTTKAAAPINSRSTATTTASVTSSLTTSSASTKKPVSTADASMKENASLPSVNATSSSAEKGDASSSKEKAQKSLEERLEAYRKLKQMRQQHSEKAEDTAMTPRRSKNGEIGGIAGSSHKRKAESSLFRGVAAKKTVAPPQRVPLSASKTVPLSLRKKA